LYSVERNSEDFAEVGSDISCFGAGQRTTAFVIQRSVLLILFHPPVSADEFPGAEC
jgi:hypothetical protein